jgi:hypothetical protein
MIMYTHGVKIYLNGKVWPRIVISGFVLVTPCIYHAVKLWAGRDGEANNEMRKVLWYIVFFCHQ